MQVAWQWQATTSQSLQPSRQPETHLSPSINPLRAAPLCTTVQVPHRQPSQNVTIFCAHSWFILIKIFFNVVPTNRGKRFTFTLNCTKLQLNQEDLFHREMFSSHSIYLLKITSLLVLTSPFFLLHAFHGFSLASPPFWAHNSILSSFLITERVTLSQSVCESYFN